MAKVPVDAPVARVTRALELLGFRTVRVGNHVAMVRDEVDGTRTPLTIPNHPRINSSTLRTILSQSGISRDDFLEAYDRS